MKLLFLFATVLCASASAGFAQSKGSLTIGGTVAPVNSVSFALLPGYSATELANGATAKMLGVVTERSNHQFGYTVSLESANARIATGNTAPKQLKNIVQYDSRGVNLTNGWALLTSASGRTPRAGYSKNLTVTTAGGAIENPSDTLTLTITAN
jgi:hypothetical protein